MIHTTRISLTDLEERVKTNYDHPFALIQDLDDRADYGIAGSSVTFRLMTIQRTRE